MTKRSNGYFGLSSASGGARDGGAPPGLPSARERASACANHVSYVVSLSVSRRRSATASQRPSAVGSVVCSTRVRARSRSQEKGEHSTFTPPLNADRRDALWMKKRHICRAFPHSTYLSTGVNRSGA